MGPDPQHWLSLQLVNSLQDNIKIIHTASAPSLMFLSERKSEEKFRWNHKTIILSTIQGKQLYIQIQGVQKLLYTVQLKGCAEKTIHYTGCTKYSWLEDGKSAVWQVQGGLSDVWLHYWGLYQVCIRKVYKSIVHGTLYIIHASSVLSMSEILSWQNLFIIIVKTVPNLPKDIAYNNRVLKIIFTVQMSSKILFYFIFGDHNAITAWASYIFIFKKKEKVDKIKHIW